MGRDGNGDGREDPNIPKELGWSIEFLVFRCIFLIIRSEK